MVEIVEYPRFVRMTKCPECGADARLEIPAEDAPEWYILCTVDDKHNYNDPSRGATEG